jgi:hypothetical protein
MQVELTTAQHLLSVKIVYSNYTDSGGEGRGGGWKGVAESI